MKTIPACWAVTTSGFSVSWIEVPFQSRQTILWRGNVLHFEVSSNENAVPVVKVKYRNAQNHCLFTSMKDHGNLQLFYYPKRLETYDSKIQVVFSRNFIAFIEMIAVEDMKYFKFEHVGLVLKYPERVSFKSFPSEPLDRSLEEFNELPFIEKYDYLLCKSNVNYIASRSPININSTKSFLFDAGEFLIEMMLQDSKILLIAGFPLGFQR